jgi:hypothetical protein
VNYTDRATAACPVIKTQRKVKHLNTLEKYDIYKISKDNLQMNDKNTDFGEIGWGGMDWIVLVPDKDKWRDLLDVAINLWAP